MRRAKRGHLLLLLLLVLAPANPGSEATWLVSHDCCDWSLLSAASIATN